jgi:hypothetical protein
MTDKHIMEMSVIELLDLYQRNKKDLEDYKNNKFMIDVDDKDELTRRRHIKEYDEFRESIMNTACFIAEKLLK